MSATLDTPLETSKTALLERQGRWIDKGISWTWLLQCLQSIKDGQQEGVKQDPALIAVALSFVLPT